MDSDLRNRFRRDFVPEPAHRPHHQPMPSQRPASPEPKPSAATDPERPKVSFDVPDHLQKRARKSRGREKPLLAIVLLLLIAAAAGGAYWYKFGRQSVPIPGKVQAAAAYPVLYPSKLPAGYTLKNTSFSTSQDAIIYEADNASGGKIVFSVQSRPANFDFPAFYQHGLGGARPFQTPDGQAAVGTANGGLLGSFVSSTSWALVTSPSGGLTVSDFHFILQNIKTTAG